MHTRIQHICMWSRLKHDDVAPANPKLEGVQMLHASYLFMSVCRLPEVGCTNNRYACFRHRNNTYQPAGASKMIPMKFFRNCPQCQRACGASKYVNGRCSGTIIAGIWPPCMQCRNNMKTPIHRTKHFTHETRISEFDQTRPCLLPWKKRFCTMQQTANLSKQQVMRWQKPTNLRTLLPDTRCKPERKTDRKMPTRASQAPLAAFAAFPT